MSAASLTVARRAEWRGRLIARQLGETGRLVEDCPLSHARAPGSMLQEA